MALTKEQREALPDSDFAVPAKRALPIHDRTHVRMAWSMLDHTKGLSDPERAAAKRSILERAHSLGIDTADWEAHRSARMEMQPAGQQDGGLRAAMHFEAMALEVPDVPGHPNRVPFSGVLTRVDQASDNPVGGAQGKRVLIPTAIAEGALASLLGMGVDYTPSLSGHDAQKKIGVITAATIEGDGIHIEGFLYGADFPAVVSEIQSKKALLGFSYEAQAAVANWNSDPVEVTSCVFTGAAILMKDKAAYTTTSLEASASSEIEMTKEEMQAILAEAMKPLNDKIAALEASTGRIEASSVLPKVKPHADRLRAAADALEKDGMGGHDRHGHVAVLHRMADKMEAEAVMGKLPHIWNDHGWLDAAAGDGAATQAAAQGGADGDRLAAMEAELKELKTKAFNAAAVPTKPTEAAAAAAAAAVKPGVQAAPNGSDSAGRDAQLKASGASVHDRLTAITLARMQTHQAAA